MSKLSTILIILLVSLSLIACGGATTTPPAESQDTIADEGAAPPNGPVIKVMEPFARASMPNGAVYMHLMNEGDADDRLISAETDVAETVELHETKIDENQVMRMRSIDAVELPAGGSATLEPGGIHVMLMGLKEELATGDTFELTLNFEQSGSQTIQIEVQEGMTMDHDMEEADATAEHSHGSEDHAASSAVAMQAQVFKAVVAAYLMDTAGFHGMDERLNDEGQIEASDAGTVNRVNRVLAVVDWPEELNLQVEELQAVLTQYAEALSNDDIEAAKPLATQAHEAQHDLYHDIEHWTDHSTPGDHEMTASETDQQFQATIAAYLMDTAGFHGMDERLNDEGQIEASDAGTVNRVNRVLAVVDWPEELNPQVEELQAVLTQYAEALSNDDIEATKPLATQAHEAQHDLSHTIEGWLSGDSGHGEEHMHGDSESHEHDEAEEGN